MHGPDDWLSAGEYPAEFAEGYESLVHPVEVDDVGFAELGRVGYVLA